MIDRCTIGFTNPNHAAAMICALLPLCWGWRRCAWLGRVDRVVRRACDEYDRVTKVDYGNGEAETFAYDRWGRLAEHTRGKTRETYQYDHFGRLAEKDENGLVYAYAYDAYGRRTSLKVRTPVGETTEERRSYDRYGRLVEIASFGVSVRYRYDARGRVSRQTVDGTPIDFAYTKYGQLAGKYLGGKERPDAAVEYEYAKSGRLVARTANGVRQTYEYDGRGQLLAVKEGGADVERYAYDKAGNMVRKSVRGKTTTFAFDGANQLVSSTTDGVTTRYAYDAEGRLVREGDRTYRYGYLDKVLSVTEGERKYAYDYHVDGQLAKADYGDGRAEEFAWDGLALIRRGDERFVNEPHVGGGNLVASSKGTTYFNDILGTTVGSKKGRAYSAAALTAFGELVAEDGSAAPGTKHSAPGTKHSAPGTFFTGKPQVDGLGHAFLFRNYRASLAKWQTVDPLGYPDGWNQLAYCGNLVTVSADFIGCLREKVINFNTDQLFSPGFIVIPWYNSEWDALGSVRKEAEELGKDLKDYVNDKLREYKRNFENNGLADCMMQEIIKYFSNLQGGPYNEIPPGDEMEPWKSILEQNEADGWHLVYGPRHKSVAMDCDNDITNAGLGALIISGCTHHWEAKFVKE